MRRRWRRLPWYRVITAIRYSRIPRQFAEGELQASRKLLEAANVMSQNPQTLQLRYLQTLNDISNENATTIVFPLPIDVMKAFTGPRPETVDQGVSNRESGESIPVGNEKN